MSTKKSKDKSKLQLNESKNITPKSDIYIKIYDISVQLIKGVIWPLFLLVLVFTYRKPISDTLDLLPSLFSRSTKIKISDFEFEIDRQLVNELSPELEYAFENISWDGMKRIIILDDGTPYQIWRTSSITTEVRSFWEELELLGLIDIIWDYEYGTSEVDYARYDITDLGLDASKIINEVLASVFSPTLQK